MATKMGQIVIELQAKTDQLEAELKNVQKQLDATANAATKSMQKGTSGAIAFGAALRDLDGSMNIRAIERFLSQFETLSKVVTAAFPVIGAIALIGYIGKLTDGVIKFAKEATSAGQKMSSAFGTVVNDMATTNDQLRMQIMKNQDEVDKLLKKPTTNGTKEALLEMKLAAEELDKALTSDLGKLNDVLKSNGVSFWQGIATSTMSTNAVNGTGSSYAEQLKGLTGQREIANSAGNNTHAAQLTKQINDMLASWDRKLDTEEKNAHEMQSFPNAPDQSKVLESITVQRDVIAATRQHQELIPAEKASEGDVKKAQQIHDNTELANKQAEAAKRAADALAAWIDKMQSSAEAVRNEAADRQKAPALIHDTNIRGFYGQDPSNTPAASGYQIEDASKSYGGFVGAQGRDMVQTIKAVQDLIAARNAAGDAATESSIKIAEETGAITKQGAAAALAALHTRQYEAEMVKLQDTLAAARKSGDTLQTQGAQTAIDAATTARGTQVAQDAQYARSISPSGAWDNIVKSFDDLPTNLMQVMTQTLHSLNSDILSGKGFAKTGQDLFKGVANAGLEKSEASLMKLFGLGGGKVQDVRIVGTVGGIFGKASSSISSVGSSVGSSIGSIASKAVGGIGGFIGGLGHMLGFADGGNPPLNVPSIVGEAGPELFVPNQSGKIIPNKSLGGDTNHIAIDARGSSNPAQTVALIDQYMKTAAPHIVNASKNAVHDHAARRPKV